MEKRNKDAIARGETPRTDDTWDKMRKRLATYKMLTEPMLAKLAAEGRLTILRNEGALETNRLRFEEIFDIRLLDSENYPSRREKF